MCLKPVTYSNPVLSLVRFFYAMYFFQLVMKEKKNCLHLHMYHLGSSDLEIHDMVDCQRNKILSRCKVEYHTYSVWGLLYLVPFYRRRSLNPPLSRWPTSYSKAVSSLPAWLGGLSSSPEVLGPSSWQDIPLSGVDKRFHLKQFFF